MNRGTGSRAVTGLAVGALATAVLLGIFVLGAMIGTPSVPFAFFDWLVRVLPGRMVTFGLETTLRALEGLGFDIKVATKAAEAVLAIFTLFIAGVLVGLIFFLVARLRSRRRLCLVGVAVGGALGVLSAVILLIQRPPSGMVGKVGAVVWAVGFFAVWGWALGRLFWYLFPPAVETTTEAVEMTDEVDVALPRGSEVSTSDVAAARALSRRRFVVEMGGLVATIVVAGAGVANVLRVQESQKPPTTVKAPIPFPNAHSPVTPAPGTRPEYTAVADHYTVDINLQPLQVDVKTWQLLVEGLVTKQLSLTLDDLKNKYNPVSRFITISCISNPVGGDLIGTTLWTGVPMRDVLAAAKPTSEARYAHLVSDDGFFESVELQMIKDDPRVMLVYEWNGQPLTAAHGYPLRIYVPDVYGMKQPKWIRRISLVASLTPGYWVERGWDPTADVETTSVIDMVAVDSAVMKNGRVYIPVGGIAYSGAKGISQVEVQVDGGPWTAAELRQPLSGLAWVIWRYDWPFESGSHGFSVRTYDGAGRLQVVQDRGASPGGATGISEYQATIPSQL